MASERQRSALQTFPNLGQPKVRAQMVSKLQKYQPGAVLALAAEGTVIIALIHVCKRVAVEPGVVHGANGNALSL